MKLKILWGALILYMMAVAVTALTSPAKRSYWPLYLPVGVLLAIEIMRCRRD